MIIKLLAISDLHGDCSILTKFIYDNIDDLNELDYIIISGDLTNIGEKYEYKKMFKELIKIIEQLNTKLIFILGNHDNPINFYDVYYNFLSEDIRKKIINIDNSIIEVTTSKNKNISIYGSQYTNKYGDWWNNYIKETQKDLTIPKSTNIDLIITHEPPSHIELSYMDEFGDIGNTELKNYLENFNLKNNILICGHVHEKGGNEAIINRTKCYNVALSPKIINLEVK